MRVTSAPLSPAYPVNSWRNGQIVSAYYSFTVPASANSGNYNVELAVRRHNSAARLGARFGLNPFEESYNERHDVTTCLIGFDFDGFAKVAKINADKAEAQFRSLAEAELAKLAPTLAKALTDAGLETQPVEIFFFPVPSVGDFRDFFQKKIGWKS